MSGHSTGKNGVSINTDTDIESDEVKKLEDFIKVEYQHQKQEGRLDATDDIDDARAEHFFNRAIGESKRMGREVHRSLQEQNKLHQELGAQKFAAWTAEHASLALNQQEQDQV